MSTDTANPTPKPTKRHAALGVGAGLLAGGAIGLAFVAPGLTSAASEVTDDLPTVVAQDETDTTDTTDDARAEPGTRLRELLQDLVDDGTLTAEQADAVTAHLVEHRPERGDGHGAGHGRRGGHPGFDGEVVAELIGIDADQLLEELRDGSSIADVAEANGVDPQTIVDALVAEAQEHLDLAVENGRLTEDEAAERAETLEERITDRVDGVRPERRGGPWADDAGETAESDATTGS